MDDTAFDEAMIAGAMALAAREGWGAVSVPAAAREAGLPLERARARFCHRQILLVRFGALADRHALAGAAPDGPIRDRLFDLLMQRLDYFNRHREGMLAVLRDPLAVALMVPAALNSMGWILEAAGGEAHGLRGRLRAKGLLAVWAWTVRAWRTDDSADLTHTMAELDRALDRAEQAARSLGDARPAPDDATTPEGDEDPPRGNRGDTGGT